MWATVFSKVQFQEIFDELEQEMPPNETPRQLGIRIQNSLKGDKTPPKWVLVRFNQIGLNISEALREKDGVYAVDVYGVDILMQLAIDLDFSPIELLVAWLYKEKKVYVEATEWDPVSKIVTELGGDPIKLLRETVRRALLQRSQAAVRTVENAKREMGIEAGSDQTSERAKGE